jgi:hypothetical protein
MKVLRRIGIEDRVRGTSFEPYSHLNRQWDTGEVKRELPNGADLVTRLESVPFSRWHLRARIDRRQRHAL